MATPWEKWFEAAWAQREDELYGSLFGQLGPGIYPLDFELFHEVFGRSEVDPRWLHVGVFECPPTEQRRSWTYVSSGLSNAWDAEEPDPKDWSGLGCELLLQCPQQSAWALSLIRKLAAYQILLSVGHFEQREVLDFWDRMPVGGPIDGAASELRTLLFAPAVEFSGTQQLSSGQFEFFQVLGLTDPELAYGREHSFETLYEALVARGAAPLVDVNRHSVL